LSPARPICQDFAVKAKTEEFLYLLFWACDMALRPTFRNLTGSFESWAYRNGFHQHLATLERQRLLESKPASTGARLHRLTEAGRSLALGRRDPLACWKRRWDGKWRLVLFDVPQRNASHRARLRRSLALRGFGYLQNSVWITPHPFTNEREAMGTRAVDVESLILLEARPGAGETDAEIVAGAWDFEAINECYAHHGRVLARWPRQAPASESAAAHMQQWWRDERLAWNKAMQLDPLLPECLHPAGYPGIKAWKRRLKILREAGRRTREFTIAA
jgi:phenylacetic acid degradation operon negative regulatory protein